MEPIDWEARLADAVKRTLAARAARKAERQEFKRRRDHGLEARYREKTARNRQEADVPHPPPCCADAEDGICEQHRQAQRVVRDGPKVRGGGGHRVIGESGRARPVRDEEDR